MRSLDLGVDKKKGDIFHSNQKISKPSIENTI